MPLQPGSRIGPYEVTAQIGVGGMGEVYRATDTNLARQVAIKVLPDAVAHDAERLARFDREAKTLAALNHPNIAQIHGLEKSDGQVALVMELVEGPTLADRIAQGPIPVDEALPIAKQIAEALEAAHERGIVHRDLKPANIKVRADGTVKVLDFGLAKALGTDGAGGAAGSISPSMSPTITTPAMTQMGVILGTAAYMSPEQAKGRPADKRADIWAFGVVFYEMLTGRSMFEAETVSEVLAAVLRADIDLKTLPADTPKSIHRLLARCLDRDPSTRLRDIGEARIALSASEAAEDSAPGAPAATAPRSWLPLAVAVTATAALTSLVAWNLRPEPTVPSPVTFSLVDARVRDAAVSPDGTRVAYEIDGDIWVRDLDDLEPRLVASVERLASVAGSGLFWSWDSTELGYAAAGALWRVAAEGGTAIRICRLENEAITGAAWGPEGRVVFASWRGSLYDVPASGAAAPTLLVEAGSGIEDFHVPRFLPNGALTYVPHWIEPREPEFHIQHDGITIVLPGSGGGSYMQGHLVSQQGGRLWARPFDLDRLEITGEPVLMVPGVRRHSASANGTLEYSPAVVDIAPASRLGWRNASGAFEALPGVARNYTEIALSPDGATAAAIVVEPEGRSIALVDVARGSIRPLVAASSNERFALRWSFDSRFVFFAEERGFVNHIVVVPTDESTPPRDVVQGTAAAPTPDGRSLVFLRDERGSGSLWSVALDDNQPVGEPRRLRESPESLEHPAVSPDGTLVAYAERPASAPRFADDYNVYISRLPDGSGQWAASVTGGNMPTWDARTGNLIYLTGTDVMTVPIAAGATPGIGTPAPLRPLHDAGWLASMRWPQLGLSPDGQRYLVLEPEEAETNPEPDRLIVVRPWFPTGP